MKIRAAATTSRVEFRRKGLATIAPTAMAAAVVAASWASTKVFSMYRIQTHLIKNTHTAATRSEWMTFRWTEGCLRNNRSNNIICIIVTTKLLLVSTRLASSLTRYIDPRAINSILPSSLLPYQKLRKKLIPPFRGIIDLRSISIRRSIIRIQHTFNSNIKTKSITVG